MKLIKVFLATPRLRRFCAPSPPLLLSACVLCVLSLTLRFTDLTDLFPHWTAPWPRHTDPRDPRDPRDLPDPRDPRDLGPYRRQFLQWDLFQRPGVGAESGGVGSGYLIYRCDSGHMSVCGGWADRLKGAMIGYLIANLTGRRFKAEFLKPKCDMLQYLVPNRVNWSLPVSPAPRPADFVVAKHVDDHHFKNNMHTTNFTHLFPPHPRYVYFQGNLDYISGLRRSALYARHLSWMQPLSSADVYAALYKRLFRLSPRLHVRLQKFLREALPAPAGRLVCVHVRVGRNPSIREDTEVRNSVDNLPKVWRFVQSQARAPWDRVFVMSDAQAVLDAATRQSFLDQLLTIPGKIVHVDKTAAHGQEEACLGLEKVILEQHVLMNCDVLVRGHSGLSIIASMVRATDKDLFCLRRNGDIVPCPRGDFSTFL